VVAGSRGYECVDGPLAGVILMTVGQPETGTMWNVKSADGATYVYRFAGHCFEYFTPSALTGDTTTGQ
jgi:hypothetical protein